MYLGTPVNLISLLRHINLKWVVIFFLLLAGPAAHAQPSGTRRALTGYFLVQCFEASLKSGCGLDIASLKMVEGDSMTCGDGAFYHNISTIAYVSPQAINLHYVDDFAYQVKLQGVEHRVYLSTNPLLLRDAGPAATALRRDAGLVKAIRQNQATADLLQHRVDSLHLNFAKKRSCTVLLYGTLSVLVLPDRQVPTTYKSPLGYHQYLLLQDNSNVILFARALKDPF